MPRRSPSFAWLGTPSRFRPGHGAIRPALARWQPRHRRFSQMSVIENAAASLPGGSAAENTGTPQAGGPRRGRGLFDREILAHAAADALRKLDPRIQIRNPVMFVVLIGTIVTLAESIAHP